MYIRAKDGVYEVVGFDKECIIPSPLIKVKNEYGKEKITHCCKGDIINQSENLEELCDCIIETKGHTGDYFHYTYTAFDEPSKERLLDDMINQDFEVYYAIWTSKGLIYVAKMNEKGELELI